MHSNDRNTRSSNDINRMIVASPQRLQAIFQWRGNDWVKESEITMRPNTQRNCCRYEWTNVSIISIGFLYLGILSVISLSLSRSQSLSLGEPTGVICYIPLMERLIRTHRNSHATTFCMRTQNYTSRKQNKRNENSFFPFKLHNETRIVGINNLFIIVSLKWKRWKRRNP